MSANASAPSTGIAARMPVLCLPPPPYSPSKPFPASSLRYIPTHPAPLPSSHPTLFVLKVHATALTRSELTWSETLSPERRTPAIPGHDVCGTIVALPTQKPTSRLVGGARTEFAIGDQVFALLSFSRDGAAAGYCLAAQEELSLLPRNLRHDEAASIPLSALSAWQAFFEHGGLLEPAAAFAGPNNANAAAHPQAEGTKRVLITGASGGVGVMAVQIAKATATSTEVGRIVGTCSDRNVAFVKGLGADKVVDYTAVPELADGLDAGEAPFDMIFDTVGGDTLAQCCSPELIRDGGRVVSVAMPLSEERKEALELMKRRVECKFFVVRPDGTQLANIGSLVEAGGLKSVVQQVFPLENGVEAMELVEAGQVRGKIVLRVD